MADAADANDASFRLSAALETALARELASTYAELNHNHFRDRLQKPVFALEDTRARLGAWQSARRTLMIARPLVLEQPWAAVREVLKHEMAHQFVDEVLGVRDETAHGPAFAEVCRRHGIDASATGVPRVTEPDTDGDDTAPHESASVLRRVSRLLALAASPNVHEAESAMKAAQRLMLAYNIDAAAAAAHGGYAFRHVGAPRKRVDAHEQVLASLLGRHFFVDVIWVPSYLVREGRGGRVLELCGTPANLDVAAYVHGFLLETGERLWRQHRRARRLDGDRERRRYLLGVMTGFNEKLEAGARESREEGLVWVGDAGLGAYLAQRYPRRRGGSGISFFPTAAYEQGRQAGRDIILRRPINDARASGAAPRLLGPSRPR